MPARAFLKIFCKRNAAQFKRLGNVLLDRVLHLVKFLLCVEEAPRDRIAQQRLAALFKLGNLCGRERMAVLLLFLQRLALAHQRLILAARRRVRQKRVNPPADGDHFRLRDDGLAKLHRLFFDFCAHKVFSARVINHTSPPKAIGLTHMHK